VERIFSPTFQVIPISFTEQPEPEINEESAIALMLMLL